MRSVFQTFQQDDDVTGQVPASLLESLIRKHIGTDKRTLQKYKRDLQEFGFLEQVNANTYKIRNDTRPYNGYHEELSDVAGTFHTIMGEPLPE